MSSVVPVTKYLTQSLSSANIQRTQFYARITTLKRKLRTRSHNKIWDIWENLNMDGFGNHTNKFVNIDFLICISNFKDWEFMNLNFVFKQRENEFFLQIKYFITQIFFCYVSYVPKIVYFVLCLLFWTSFSFIYVYEHF